MKAHVIAAADLDDRQLDRWRALQRANPTLDSPYFSPEFTLAVAAVCDVVRVGVVEDRGEITGFLPFQSSWGAARPVGAPLSDHHGVICAAGTVIDWPLLLRAMDVAYFHFDHLPAAQAPSSTASFSPEAKRAESPGLALSRGFNAWKEQRGRRVQELDRKARKLGREVGPLRFDAHTDDDAVLAFVLRLKSEQCKRTGLDDVFAPDWTRALVDEVWRTQTDGFAGRLSALWAGDHLVAAHFGMRSGGTWHWWFPVYDHAFAKHSPGALLLLHTAQAAADAGMAVLDLGKGDDVYKESFADWSLPLAEGTVMRPALRSGAHVARVSATRWLRTSPLVEPLKPLLRTLRRVARGEAPATAKSATATADTPTDTATSSTAHKPSATTAANTGGNPSAKPTKPTHTANATTVDTMAAPAPAMPAAVPTSAFDVVDVAAA